MGKIFTPTALSNDGIAYGEAVDQDTKIRIILPVWICYTRTFKDRWKDINLTHVAVSYVDHDIVVFEEEYDPAQTKSTIFGG